MNNDTIFALASAPGRSGVSVFRLSGAKAGDFVTQFCMPQNLPSPRQAALRRVMHADGTLLDSGLVLYFKAPASFTGEDVVELQLHGGRAVTEAMIKLLSSLDGWRMARPGEFSRRAFENNKMDLTEAEAIADLVDAETSAQHRQALRQMDGALGRLYHGWADRLMHLLAYVEADIDFSDEELPEDLLDASLEDARRLESEIQHHLEDSHRGERLREGFVVALLGVPNAGKSSLLNKLAKRDVAIVTPTAGTTRDALEVHLDLGGYPVTLVDTAGLRESDDLIEQEGVRRAKERAAQADIHLLVFDGAIWPKLDEETLALAGAHSLMLVNKKDLVAADLIKPEADLLFVSAKDGDGLDDLIDRLTQMIDQHYGLTEAPSLTRARHRTALEEALSHIRRALQASAPELRAEDFRLAVRSLGQITGRVDVEQLLDKIFKDFCIGK